MQAHTVIETKWHKALGAQLLLNKQIPWTGDIFLEGTFVAQTLLLSSGSPGKPKPNLPPMTHEHTHTQKLKMSPVRDCHPLESPLLCVLSRSLLRRFYPSVKLKAHDITNSCPEGMPKSLEALLPQWACPTQSPTRPPQVGGPSRAHLGMQRCEMAALPPWPAQPSTKGNKVSPRPSG